MSSEREKADPAPGPRGGTLLADLSTGFMFLTRLPVPGDGSRPLPHACRSFPVVGAAIGLAGGLVFLAAVQIGLTSWIAAFLSLAATAGLTGALHEDGLSDALDGLWGGHTPERRLEIMRDSRIGGYGAVGLVISLGLRASALAALGDPQLVLGALVAAHSLARANMVWFMRGLTPAGKSGLAASVGRPTSQATATALALGAAIALPATTPFASPVVLIPTLAVGLAAGWLFMTIAKSKLGGYNGDCLGAGEQISEVVILLALVSVLTQAGGA